MGLGGSLLLACRTLVFDWPTKLIHFPSPISWCNGLGYCRGSWAKRPDTVWCTVIFSFWCFIGVLARRGVYMRENGTIALVFFPKRAFVASMFLACRNGHCGGRKGQVANLGSKNPQQPKCLQRKGQPNMTTIGLITEKDDIKREIMPKDNGFTFTLAQGGRASLGVFWVVGGCAGWLNITITCPPMLLYMLNMYSVIFFCVSCTSVANVIRSRGLLLFSMLVSKTDRFLQS